MITIKIKITNPGAFLNLNLARNLNLWFPGSWRAAFRFRACIGTLNQWGIPSPQPSPLPKGRGRDFRHLISVRPAFGSRPTNPLAKELCKVGPGSSLSPSEGERAGVRGRSTGTPSRPQPGESFPWAEVHGEPRRFFNAHWDPEPGGHPLTPTLSPSEGERERLRPPDFSRPAFECRPTN